MAGYEGGLFGDGDIVGWRKGVPPPRSVEHVGECLAGPLLLVSTEVVKMETSRLVYRTAMGSRDDTVTKRKHSTKISQGGIKRGVSCLQTGQWRGARPVEGKMVMLTASITARCQNCGAGGELGRVLAPRWSGMVDAIKTGPRCALRPTPRTAKGQEDRLRGSPTSGPCQRIKHSRLIRGHLSLTAFQNTHRPADVLGGERPTL